MLELLRGPPVTFATHQSATMPRASRFSYLKTDFETTIFGPTASLSPNATYAERQAYRRDVLRLPGPVDRWLLTNIRSPRINFLQDYLMFADVKNEYVICTVEIESETVCLLAFITIWILLSYFASFRAQIISLSV
jgi:hypothetical protein